jgi:hypothetical protein
LRREHWRAGTGPTAVRTAYLTSHDDIAGLERRCQPAGHSRNQQPVERAAM